MVTVTLRTMDGRRLVRCFEGAKCVRKIDFDTVGQIFAAQLAYETECEESQARVAAAWKAWEAEQKAKLMELFPYWSAWEM